MRAGHDVPPLMFTADEAAALVVGARQLQAWGGADMARAAEEALVKIDAVLPDAARLGARRRCARYVDVGHDPGPAGGH
jgi:predicted DNA-binding transcriptional regulator YafY